jgi:hypothetical protein
MCRGTRRKRQSERLRAEFGYYGRNQDKNRLYDKVLTGQVYPTYQERVTQQS